MTEDIQNRLIDFIIYMLDDRKDMLDRFNDVLDEDEKNILINEIELCTILLGLVSNSESICKGGLNE